MSALAGSIKHNSWLQLWARLGFAVGGIVYVIVGLLAVLVAYRGHGSTPGPDGAIERIGTEPLGHILLIFIMVGLFGYATWCLVQAFFDTDDDGTDLKGIAVRTGEFCSGIAYYGLALLSLHDIQGKASRANSAVHWTAIVLAHSWGRWVVELGGIALGAIGFILVVYGLQERFRKYLEIAEANGSERNWIIRFGKWGYSAQGLVFCMIGVFLIGAAVHSDAAQARGLDGALEWLAQQTFGPWLLGIVAAGLTAYGLFMLVECRYRRLV